MLAIQYMIWLSSISYKLVHTLRLILMLLLLVGRCMAVDREFACILLMCILVL